MLEVRNLSVSYGSLRILEDVSFSVQEGQWLMIAGPNGAGKSTALEAITQGIPYTGQALFQGRDLKTMKPQLRAKSIGVLSQNHFVGYDFSVEEVVRLGRYAHGPGLFRHQDMDQESAVEEALELTGMAAQRHQSVLTLSGGELQRTFLAQVFAQQPQLLLLDEPTNHLDLVYQKQVFQLIAKWLEQPGRAVASVVHDLSLAKAFGTHGVLLNKGRRVCFGPVAEVLQSKYLDPVYQMDVAGWMGKLLGQWEETP